VSGVCLLVPSTGVLSVLSLFGHVSALAATTPFFSCSQAAHL
jgi:hypothetical protein